MDIETYKKQIVNRKDMNFIISFSEISNHLVALMNTDKPLWIARFGGSDTNFIHQWYLDSSNQSNELLISIIKKYNGFFDYTNSTSVIELYIKNYIDSCYTADASFFLGHELENITNNNYNFRPFNDNCLFFSYTYTESIKPFLDSFKIWGENKKILIISPFSESLKFQTQPDRINNLLKDYKFPNCSFEFFNVPVTYNNPHLDLNHEENKMFANETKDEVNYIMLCIKLMDEIRKLDFDIALLSCGSYSMFFGSRIKREMGKKAIYIGGILNVLFNIYGARYDNPFHNTFVNLDYQIEPFENKKYFNENNTHFKSEGFNAYFGTKKNKYPAVSTTENTKEPEYLEKEDDFDLEEE